MCLYPRLISNPKYTSTAKNKGNIPLVKDPRALRVPIGCGNCMECRKQKARGWQVRLLEDIRTNTNGKFIALTLSNENYTKLYNEIDPNIKGYAKDNAIISLAIRRFLERWRKQWGYSPRHWLVTELGHKGTENIHVHGIIWTDKVHQIDKHWQYGFIWRGYKKNGKLENYVNEKTVNYIIKYVSKMDVQHKTYKSKIFTSAGIGRNYTKRKDAEQNKYIAGETKETYRTRSGFKIALPNYWRNKIYSEDERELLWMEKLDKEERWVCGEKIDVSQTNDIYWELLKWHRENNRQLGYGTWNDWKRAEYEYQRRILVQNTRLTGTAPPGFKQKDLDIRERARRTAPTARQQIQKIYLQLENIDYIANLKQTVMKITTTKTVQTGNEILGTKEKTLYYLIIENKIGDRLVINVGQKTHDSVVELQKKDK